MKNVRLLGYIFILPAVIAMILVHIIPMAWGILISFKDLTIRTIRNWQEAPWCGIDNYIKAFNPVSTVGQRFMRSLRNIVFYGFFTISIGFFIALGVALLLNKPFIGRTFVRGVILIPYITGFCSL